MGGALTGLAPDGQPGVDGEAAVGAGAGVELAPEQVHPLAHADQPRPASRGRRPRGVRSEWTSRRRRRSTLPAAGGRPPRCGPATVGRPRRSGPAPGPGPGPACKALVSLLDDPVGRQVDPRPAAAPGRFDHQLDPEPGPPRPARPATAPRPGRAGGEAGAWSPSPRSTPSSRRISTRAWRPVAAIASKAPAARAGSVATATRPASACTTIMLTWWATTSCSSRAIRARSEATARRASSARSRSSRAPAPGARRSAPAAPGPGRPAPTRRPGSETKAASTTSASARGRAMTTTTTAATAGEQGRRRLPQAPSTCRPRRRWRSAWPGRDSGRTRRRRWPGRW